MSVCEFPSFSEVTENPLLWKALVTVRTLVTWYPFSQTSSDWNIFAIMGNLVTQSGLLGPGLPSKILVKIHVIQIKICAEYRDMLPRPRLVCQEPGLRPIGRSPGVPDKSSRGLGSMSRYSAQILICFIAYIFSIFNFSVGLVGDLAELPPCTVPPATVHCYQNEAAQCSSDNQISQHALLRGSRKKHSLAFMPQNWWN